MKLTGDRCQCTVCGEYFNSTFAFDKHRYGTYENSRSCMTVEEMLSEGWIKNRYEFWVTKAYNYTSNKGNEDD